jgi:hypothetical protein
VTAQTGLLEGLLDSQELAIGDLNFIEVLQGCRIEKEFNEVRRLLGRLTLVVLGGEDVVVQAAKNYLRLRQLGVAVRGTIDVVLEPPWILRRLQLLRRWSHEEVEQVLT